MKKIEPESGNIEHRTSNIEHRMRLVAAFTLIELLIVIAIIAILASLIFPITGALDKKKKIAVAQTQLKALEAAIDGYKTKLGYYPPDNTNNPAVNPLYFELLGTTNDGAGKPAPTTWVTMDNSAQVNNSLLVSLFSLQGLANTSTRAHSDDAGAAATTFLNNLTPNQIGVINTNPTVEILVCSVEWPATINPSPSSPIPTSPTLNPWHYVSTHPTNNTSTYDLWVDVVSGKKTNRVSNWSTTPIQL
jgi:prepilin-type N-terminal cleavage/methylation domain-containing protein